MWLVGLFPNMIDLVEYLVKTGWQLGGYFFEKTALDKTSQVLSIAYILGVSDHNFGHI